MNVVVFINALGTMDVVEFFAGAGRSSGQLGELFIVDIGHGVQTLFDLFSQHADTPFVIVDSVHDVGPHPARLAI